MFPVQYCFSKDRTRRHDWHHCPQCVSIVRVQEQSRSSYSATCRASHGIWQKVVVLPGHGTVDLHVPGTYYPNWAGSCRLVYRPESKPPALGIVLACGEVNGMHPQARLISSTLFPGILYILVSFSRLRMIHT